MSKEPTTASHMTHITVSAQHAHNATSVLTNNDHVCNNEECPR